MRVGAIDLILVGIMISPIAHADPFERADASIGQALVEKHCISCHASSYGGDGSGIYTREDRKVKDGSSLVQQIRNCNTNLGLQWFEDEEFHVARYLNNTYYKFDR
jgi:cytochrome c2